MATRMFDRRPAAALTDPQERIAAIVGRHGLTVDILDVSELHKAESGLTCMSLLFETDGPSQQQ